MENFSEYIRNIPDFPVIGIMFKDITTLLKEPEVFSSAIDKMYEPYLKKNISKIVGIESRGFIFGSAMAYKMKTGFVPIRKPGKLPAPKRSEEYTLEYGTDQLEIHEDAILKGENVLLVDDLLATGGTAAAACRLIEQLGGRIVGVSFLIELLELEGRKKLPDYSINTIIQY